MASASEKAAKLVRQFEVDTSWVADPDLDDEKHAEALMRAGASRLALFAYIASLEADAARVDWIAREFPTLGGDGGAGYEVTYFDEDGDEAFVRAESLRDALDAAMRGVRS